MSPPVTMRPWLISPTYPVQKPQPGKAPPDMPLPDLKDLSQWKMAYSDRSGMMNLLADRSYVEWVGIWALCYVKSPNARTVNVIGIGDDSAIVYVNGRRVANKDGRPSGNTNGRAELRAGWNAILLRCDQYMGGWGFSFNIQDDKGGSPTDLRFAPQPKDDFQPKVMEPKPVLAAWDYGKGRAMFSAAIFSNDESSEKFGAQWKDFGKYYAQVFAWLGEHSRNVKVPLKDAPAEAPSPSISTSRSTRSARGSSPYTATRASWATPWSTTWR